MAASSYLSNSRFGYDFVVTTSQASINATMKRYLYNIKTPGIEQCWVIGDDDNGTPTLITLEELLELSDGSNPFELEPDIDPKTNQDYKNLARAGFLRGFRAKMGTPKGVKPGEIPDIVEFNAGGITQVLFRLMCAEFTVAELTSITYSNGKVIQSWYSATQSPKSPWLFEAKVNLSRSLVAKNDYSKMPEDVRKAIDNLGEKAFSVQQLYFNLSTAVLTTIPNIKGVPVGSTLETILKEDFLRKYFDRLRLVGDPLLGVGIVEDIPDKSTLQLQELEMQVNPFLDSSGRPKLDELLTDKDRAATTLSYLCATKKNTLPSPARFDWNWMSTQDIESHHGVLSINRNTLAEWLRGLTQGLAARNCWQPKVAVWKDGVNIYFNFGAEYVPPVAQMNKDGKEVFSYTWKSPLSIDWTELLNSRIGCEMDAFFTMSVEFEGRKILVKQRIGVWLKYIWLVKSPWPLPDMDYGGSGLIIDRTITDTYELGIDQNGKIVTEKTTKSENNDYDPSSGGFLAKVTARDQIMNFAKTQAASFGTTDYPPPPLQGLEEFVFPGGEVFTFSSLNFSRYQDLTALITYLNPNDNRPVHMAVHSGGPQYNKSKGVGYPAEKVLVPAHRRH